MKKKMLVLVFAALAVVVLAINGCGDNSGSQKSANANPPPANSGGLPLDFWLNQAPAGAKNVGYLKKEAKEGDEVVLRGQVGGQKEVFNPDRAVFLIADLNLPPCSMRPGDKCTRRRGIFVAKPKRHSRQILQRSKSWTAPESSLKLNLHGLNGIDHLSVLVVKGTVARREQENLIINATGIFVEKSAESKTAGAAH